MPARGLTFTAVRGEGAHCNGEPLQSGTKVAMDQATVLTAKPNMRPEFWAAGRPPPFQRTFRSSLAYRLALIASGRFDAMLTFRNTWEWGYHDYKPQMLSFHPGVIDIQHDELEKMSLYCEGRPQILFCENDPCNLFVKREDKFTH